MKPELKPYPWSVADEAFAKYWTSSEWAKKSDYVTITVDTLQTVAKEASANVLRALHAAEERAERLEGEVQLERHDTCVLLQRATQAEQSLAQERAARVRAETDAGRYRWLRERGHYDAALPMNFHCNFPATCFRYDTLGAAIDAAMQGGDK